MFIFLLVLVPIASAGIAAVKVLHRNPDVIMQLENEKNSIAGVSMIVHNNNAKPVENSFCDANITLPSFGVPSFDIKDFYNALNKK